MSASQTLSGMRIAQIFSVPAAGFLSGMIGCMSIAAIPALALAPADTAAKQWKKVYDTGSTAMPPLVLAVGSCFGFLAYRTRRLAGRMPDLSFDITRPAVLYTIAAVSLPSIVPYTIAFMKPTNDVIMARAVQGVSAAANDAQIAAMLQKWAGLNLVRAVLVGTGALLAAGATMFTV